MTKPCRSCGSSDIYSREVVGSGSESAMLLPAAGWFRSTKFRLEVCGACGLTAFYVPERFLPMIKERFGKDPPAAS